MRAPRPATANSAGGRARAALAGALIGLATLAGCTDEPPGDATSAPYDLGAQPATTAAAAVGGGATTASLTPQAAPKIDADPKRLIGLDRKALTALLGTPAFRRKDRPAEFWRYNGDSCMLDLYLYGPAQAAAKDKTMRVRHVAAHGANDGPADTGDCLRSILRAKLDADAS